MAAKRFGSATLNENEPYRLFTSTEGKDTTANFSVVNHTNEVARIGIAMVPSQLNYPRNQDYFVLGTVVSIGGYFEYRGLAIEENQSIWLISDTTGVTVIATGFEEEIE